MAEVGTTGFLKKTAVDTYTLDTSTYLTAEADTLQTVTTRGASSDAATITLSASTSSTNTTSGALVVTGGVGIGGNLNVGTDVVITGNLTVNGTTSTINSTTVSVDDKNIELGSTASPSDATADGGGITLKGDTDKTISWVNSTDAWTSSEHIEVAAGKTIILGGATSGRATITAPSVASTPTLTLPTVTGTFALTSDLPTVNDGTLSINGTPAAAATNKTVELVLSGTFSANTASNITLEGKVGPALTNLASTMTGAGSGFLKKNGADAYQLDTTTYLTSTITGDVQINNGAIVLAPSTTAKIWKTAKTFTLSANTETAIDSWEKTLYRSAIYNIQVVQGTKYEIGTIHLTHDGTGTYITNYAMVSSAVIGTGNEPLYTASIVSDTLSLKVTVSDAASTNAEFLMERTLFAV